MADEIKTKAVKEALLDQCRKQAQKAYDDYVARLPDYCFAYEEGSRYVRRENAERAERVQQQELIRCLSGHLK